LVYIYIMLYFGKFNNLTNKLIMKKITFNLTKSIWRSCFLAMTLLFSLSINSQDLAMQGIGDYNVGNVDGAGGSDGKFIHLVANADIADLSMYSMELYANANTSSNSTFTFETGTSASAGDHILVARDIAVLTTYMDYAVFDQSIESSFPNWNGDDSVELYMNDDLIETYGSVGTDGTGEAWEYLDSWAYKVNGAWTYGGVNCTDGSTTSATSDCPYPYLYEAAGCDYTLSMVDSYGDGWNGASLEILADGVSVGTYSNTSAAGAGEAQTVTVALSEGQVITSVWTSGSYDGEITYSLLDSYGNVVVSSAAGAFADFTATCLEMFDVTFSVNTATITDGVGPNGMYIGGGIIGGANAYAMTDADADGTWEITLSMAAGTTGNYIFLNSPNDGNDWGAKENLNGQSCADGQYDDRLLAPVTADTTLLHCFGSCETDGTCPSNYYTVTFNVNTANIDGGVGPNGMYVGGGFVGDAQGLAMSDDDGDGTWTATLEVLEGQAGNFTYLNSPNDGGDWGAKEDLAGQECGDPNEYNDRTLEAVTADTTLLHCYGSCETDGTCGGPAEPITNAYRS
jgi:hypothetical protein